MTSAAAPARITADAQVAAARALAAGMSSEEISELTDFPIDIIEQ
ncbi:hypothetical protein [Streptomyces sp. UH6]|nr:hypothetical protein [Streptomyces sp. UH6]